VSLADHSMRAHTLRLRQGRLGTKADAETPPLFQRTGFSRFRSASGSGSHANCSASPASMRSDGQCNANFAFALYSGFGDSMICWVRSQMYDSIVSPATMRSS
jgi:hypothetical protein